MGLCFPLLSHRTFGNGPCWIAALHYIGRSSVQLYHALLIARASICDNSDTVAPAGNTIFPQTISSYAGGLRQKSTIFKTTTNDDISEKVILVQKSQIICVLTNPALDKHPNWSMTSFSIPEFT